MSADAIARLRAADPLRGRLPPALARMPEAPRPQPVPRRHLPPLVVANLALLVAVAAHGLDHARPTRRLEELTTEVLFGGFAMSAVTLTSLALAVLAHRRAPHVAVAGGAWIAVAVVASHFLPHWSAFSNSYADLGVDAFSYAAALAVAVAGIAVGAVGVSALRRRVPT